MGKTSRKKTPNFEQLKAKWYKKLKSSGFEDIEQDDGNLRSWSSSFYRARRAPETLAAIEDYYRLAGHFLHEHEFASETERLIWEYHANGLSGKDISETLAKVKIKVATSTALAIIKRLEGIMRRKYLPGSYDT